MIDDPYYSGTATASCPACGLASAASLLSSSLTTVTTCFIIIAIILFIPILFIMIPQVTTVILVTGEATSTDTLTGAINSLGEKNVPVPFIIINIVIIKIVIIIIIIVIFIKFTIIMIIRMIITSTYTTAFYWITSPTTSSL